jgi:hypothetical protein
VVGLIRAIEDVLEDCSQEASAATVDWSLATQRLIGQGVLVDTGEVLTLVGEDPPCTVERAHGVQADLDLWRQLTALILADEHFEQAIYEELDDH